MQSTDNFRALPPLLSEWIARYHRGPDHPAKLRFCGWLYQFLRRIEVRLIIKYPDQRAWIALDPSDAVEGTILQNGHYEPEVWDALVAHVRDGDVVWDIGAHIGGVALRAAVNPSIRQVVCFEPAPDTFAVLKANAMLNQRLALQLFNVALSDTVDTVNLSEGSGHNRGQRTMSGGRLQDVGIPIQTTTIDEVILAGAASLPQLMKIDVEGWEEHVLAGGEMLFRKNPPRAVVFESSYETAADGILKADVERFFVDHGYSVCHIPRPTGATDLYENFLATYCL